MLFLMAKTLEKLIKERKNQAKKKKIYEKADLIVRHLGSVFHSAYHSSLKTVVFKFRDEYFSINGCYHTDYSPFLKRRYGNIFVHDQDGTVFLGDRTQGFFRHLEIESYIPGLWEEKIDSLYGAAKEKEREAREKIAREDKGPDEAELRRKFGF